MLLYLNILVIFYYILSQSIVFNLNRRIMHVCLRAPATTLRLNPNRAAWSGIDGSTEYAKCVVSSLYESAPYTCIRSNCAR